MAGVKISALPAVPSALLTDIFPGVQGGVTSKETLQQVLTLFNANIQIDESQVNNLLTDLNNKVSISGDTMTGPLISAGDPSTALEFANKQYVDSIAEGLHFHESCDAATTANLAGYTYDNGSAGVGATLTAGVNGAFSTDGVSPPLNARILVAFQTSQPENGIYVLTQVGDGSNPAILTRALDYDQPAEIDVGDAVLVETGTLYTGTLWFQTATVVTIGVSNIVFTLTNSAANIVAGTGLTKSGNTISLITPVASSLGGTGVNNGASTFTIGGSFSMVGAFTFAGTLTGNTAVTFPTSGTLATTAQVSTRFNSVAIQVFTANGTYTPTTGMVFCIAEVVGGGGGGGGSTGGGAGFASAGAGGGGGGYSRELLTAATIGASQAVTVGAGGTAGASPGGNGGTGGTSSLGALLSATGGLGGGGQIADGGVAWYTTAGGGGGASGGSFNVQGGSGIPALIFGTRGAAFSGAGGNSVYGGGANGTNIQADGSLGGNYGGGGSGAASTTNNHAGGAGAPGIVIITEFIAT